MISIVIATGLDEEQPRLVHQDPALLTKAIYILLYGDLMMQCVYRTRPYEAEKGSVDALHDKYMARMKAAVHTLNKRSFERICQETITAFDQVPLVNDRSKPRVGVVGEILVKFHPTANNQLVKVIEAEGCEANVPGLVDFFLFGIPEPRNAEGRAWLQGVQAPHAHGGYQAHRGRPQANGPHAGAVLALRAVRGHL